VKLIHCSIQRKNLFNIVDQCPMLESRFCIRINIEVEKDLAGGVIDEWKLSTGMVRIKNNQHADKGYWVCRNQETGKELFINILNDWVDLG